MIDLGARETRRSRSSKRGPGAGSPPALHSAARPGWGTPRVARLLCASFLAPAAVSVSAIDFDYASSSYWQLHWPEGTRPTAYLDGSEGRDVLVEADRRSAVRTRRCGSGFLNAPGLEAGRMIQRCWELFEADHRSGWLGSGAWVGFSLEQFASLQGVGARNPLSCRDGSVVTIVPSRRIRYVLHPEELIDLLLSKQVRRKKGSSQWRLEQRQIEKLRGRQDDTPVPGGAPSHASYVALLPSRAKSVRRRQLEAVSRFLKLQHDDPSSPFQTVEVVGSLDP